LGYDLETSKVRPGDKIYLTLYWQAKKPIDKDYSVFTHLVGEDMRIWGQQDNYPQRGQFPTSKWVPGQVVIDEYEIPVYKDAPPGLYELTVGMYLLSTMERLPIKGGWDRIMLTTIEVEKP